MVELAPNPTKQLISSGEFQDLLIDRIGWDNPEDARSRVITVPGRGAETEARFTLEPVAEKRGVTIFRLDCGDTIYSSNLQDRIGRQVQKSAHEHLVIYHTADFSQQRWVWPVRETGKPVKFPGRDFVEGQNANTILGFLKEITFELKDEHELTLTDVTERLRRVVNSDRVTKRFYDEFSNQRKAFSGFIDGIDHIESRDWYAAVMLNRLMFCWFLQSKGILDSNERYLQDRLAWIQRGEVTHTNFHNFYRSFLRVLFHDGLNTPEGDRPDGLRDLIGDIPYINGGIFGEHQLEIDHAVIDIPDAAFASLFEFFGRFTWHLDDRPLGNENEINPDVLGYIFEKFVNQKEKGAYYTKEDVTGYISQNTILPWLLDRTKKDVSGIFRPGEAGSVWSLFEQDPAEYIYGSMKYGVIADDGTVLDMPKPLLAGEHDYGQRGNWNEKAVAPYNLPTETWREYFHRRKRTLELIEKLRNGEIHEIDDLITWNLNIRQFVQDAVVNLGGDDFVNAMWKAVSGITILDPTVGSGAFLFAAVKVIEPIYESLLDRMDEAVARGTNYKLFTTVTEEVKRHPNRAYYIIRQIILNNLYGVDIEEEAVEICKLRLFLLLASKLEENEKIEPLPDIDFNIRAGNTLVGYANEIELRGGLGGTQLALDCGDPLGPILEKLEIADKAWTRFQEAQDDVETASELHEAKATYQNRLTSLRDELDVLLHKQDRSTRSIAIWKATAQPFHWFSDFHRIVAANGGFDVVVGNPPYVAASKVKKKYRIDGFQTSSCPDIYAMVVEQSTRLLSSTGTIGMIVPLSLTFSKDLRSLRSHLSKSIGASWFSSFAKRPSALFDGVDVRNTIVVGYRGSGRTKPRATRIHRWYSESRFCLFENLQYAEFGWEQFDGLVPRANSETMIQALARARFPATRTVGDLLIRTSGKWKLWYRTSAYNWLSFSPNEPPSEDFSGNPIRSSGYSAFNLGSESDYLLLLMYLNGRIPFVLWTMFGDDLNVTKAVVSAAPFPAQLNESVSGKIQELAKTLEDSLDSTLNYMNSEGKRIARYDLFKLSHLIRESDELFRQSLEFTLEVWEEMDLLLAQTIKTERDE